MPEKSEEEYFGPTVIETASTCPTLARLPKLPVTVLILTDAAAQGPRDKLATRLERLADELGVDDGVRVSEHRIVDWPTLDARPPRGRADAVFVTLRTIPASWDDPGQPRDEAVDALARLLDVAETRFGVLCPAEEGSQLREALARRVLDRGGPPLVLLPDGMDDPTRFLEAFFERLLHDAPLLGAIRAAAGPQARDVVLMQPPGRRHGLDLGRLLEDQRRRIEEGGSALRIFRRQLEASRPAGPDPRWEDVAAGTERRQSELDVIKASVEEINRDRDPAGWSRLADAIERLRTWEVGLDGARAALEASQQP